MEKVRLGDIVDFSNGYAFKSCDYVGDSNTLNCRMSNIRPDGSFDIKYSAKYLPDTFIEKYSNYILKDGDLIIAMTDMAGDPKILGIPTVVKTEGYNVLMNQRVGKIKLKTNEILPEFLKYSLSSNSTREYFKSFAGGGVQLNIGKKEILNTMVYICDIIQQKYIVSNLDKVTDLINKRKSQLEKFDELVKARFVELFGDPIENPFGWEQTTLKEIGIGKLSYGSGASACEYDGNIRYVRITDIDNSGNLNDDIVSPNVIDEKYILNDGDILFARSGATVGKSYRYRSSDGKCLYAGYLIRLVPNTELVLPDYVFYYTKTGYYERFIESNMKVVAQPNINAQQYGDLTICIPPMELQKEFLTFVKQTDKSKLEIQKGLEKLELIKKALMQKYFK